MHDPASDDIAGGYGLYQWVIEDASGEDSVWHRVYICKYGEGYNEPPRCPPEACIDSHCTQCKQDWRDQ